MPPILRLARLADLVRESRPRRTPHTPTRFFCVAPSLLCSPHLLSPNFCSFERGRSRHPPAEEGKRAWTMDARRWLARAAASLPRATGRNKASPACVTPPASTTDIRIKMFMQFDTLRPRTRAVSRTTSRAVPIAPLRRLVTFCAVILRRSPSTCSRLSTQSQPPQCFARAFGDSRPDAYASRNRSFRTGSGALERAGCGPIFFRTPAPW